MMKRIATTALTILCFLPYLTFGQKYVKQSKKALDKGQYLEAERIITEASQGSHMTAEGWLIYAKVYAKMIQQGIKKSGMDESDMVRAVTAAWTKAASLDIGNTITESMIMVDKSNLYIFFSNKANDAYIQRKLKEAEWNFGQLTLISPQDTFGYFNAALCAMEAQDYKAAEPYLQSLVEMDKASPRVMMNLISIQNTFLNKPQAAYLTAKKAIKKYPNNLEVQKFFTQVAFQSGKSEEANSSLQKLLVAEPNNATLWLMQGILAEKQKDNKQAITAYKRALELNPNSYEAAYNVGSLYFNRAGDRSKALMDMSSADFNKHKEAYEEEIKKDFKLALPYLETCAKLRPKARVVWSSLSAIYLKLDMPEKAKIASDNFSNN
ncbi:MAG: tetratricopeptide repeat protein [Bacteroidota bacterium]